MKKISDHIRSHKSIHGFTLIELLVVIAIIALLLSIILPSLKKAKEKAREVICKSYLKQWGYVSVMYAEDSEGKMPDGATASAASTVWMNIFRDYYQEPKIRLCPAAVRVSPDPADICADNAVYYRIRGFKDKAWTQVYKDTTIETDTGSYAMNSWAMNPPLGWAGGSYNNYFWRNAFVKGGSNVPLFMDARTPGLNPKINGTDELAPDVEDDMDPLGWSNSMKRVCTDRHSGAINVSFLDQSVKKVGLKGLWKLKWSQEWDIGALPSNAWPSWMQGFDD